MYLQFEAAGEPHYSFSGIQKLYDEIWKAIDSPATIRYMHLKSIRLDSQAVRRWISRRRKLYGPPSPDRFVPFMVRWTDADAEKAMSDLACLFVASGHDLAGALSEDLVAPSCPVVLVLGLALPVKLLGCV